MHSVYSSNKNTDAAADNNTQEVFARDVNNMPRYYGEFEDNADVHPNE